MGSVAPILGGMALFANSFSKAYDREREAKRQETEDAFKEEQRNRQRQEWKESDQLKSDLKSAAAPVDVQEGANGMVKPDTMDNRDVGLPENADQPAGGLMAGQFKVGQQSFADKATATKVATEANSADGVNSRTALAYRKHGQVEKAMSMENAMMDQKAKRLGLSVEEMKFADMQTNKALDNVLRSGKNWYEGAAQFVTDHQTGGLKDMKARADLSADGKTVTLVAIKPDGTEQATGTYPADEKGMLQFQEKFAAIPLETRMSVMRDKLKADKEQANKDREFGIKKQEVESNARLHDAQANYFNTVKGRSAGGAGGSGLSMDGIDGQLKGLFTVEDPATGAKSLDTRGLLFTRQLATTMPEASSGDANGAALRAVGIYRKALQESGGDHDKAVALIAPPTKAAAAPMPANNTSNSMTADEYRAQVAANGGKGPPLPAPAAARTATASMATTAAPSYKPGEATQQVVDGLNSQMVAAEARLSSVRRDWQSANSLANRGAFTAMQVQNIKAALEKAEADYAQSKSGYWSAKRAYDKDRGASAYSPGNAMAQAQSMRLQKMADLYNTQN